MRPVLVAVVTRRCGVECDPGHAVDGRAELVVRDPDELALDHDVAHGQEAAAVDAAQSAASVKSAAASISTASTPRFDQRSYCPSSGL